MGSKNSGLVALEYVGVYAWLQSFVWNTVVVEVTEHGNACSGAVVNMDCDM